MAYAGTETEYKSDVEPTKYIPYLALMGELWGAFRKDFEENWPRYNGTTLYVVLMSYTVMLRTVNTISLSRYIRLYQLCQERCDSSECMEQPAGRRRQMYKWYAWYVPRGKVICTSLYTQCTTRTRFVRIAHQSNYLQHNYDDQASSVLNDSTYSISQEICTRFCCALLCNGYAIVHNEFTCSIYPYSSGLLCWHWGNR